MTPPRQDHDERLLSRRELVAAAGALGLGGGLYLLPHARAQAASLPASAGAACVLTPEQTEGPYYINDHLVRRDIREDRRGALLDLRLTVEHPTTCRPVAGATVEIWHADAGGTYSGFGAGQGRA